MSNYKYLLKIDGKLLKYGKMYVNENQRPVPRCSFTSLHLCSRGYSKIYIHINFTVNFTLALKGKS